MTEHWRYSSDVDSIDHTVDSIKKQCSWVMIHPQILNWPKGTTKPLHTSPTPTHHLAAGFLCMLLIRAPYVADNN